MHTHPKVAAVASQNWPFRHDGKCEPLLKFLKANIHEASSDAYPLNLPTRIREDPQLFIGSSRNRVGEYQPISINWLLLMLSLWACGQRAGVVHHVHGEGARSCCGFVDDAVACSSQPPSLRRKFGKP